MSEEFRALWRLVKASIMVLCEQVESGCKVLRTDEMTELRAEVDRLIFLPGVTAVDSRQSQTSLVQGASGTNIEDSSVRSGDESTECTDSTENIVSTVITESTQSTERTESTESTESTQYTTATEGYGAVCTVELNPAACNGHSGATMIEMGPSGKSAPVALPPPRTSAFTTEEQEILNEAFLRCMQGYEDIDVCGRRLARQFQRKCTTLRHQLTPKLRAVQMTRKQWKEAAVICPQLKRYPPGISISRVANSVQQATTGSHHSQSSQGVPDHQRRHEGHGYPPCSVQQTARADPAYSNSGGGGALQDDRVPASAPGATGNGSSTTSEQRRGGGGDSVNSGSSDRQSITQRQIAVDPALQNPFNQSTSQCGASPAAVTAQTQGSTSSTHSSSSAQPRLSPPPMMRILTPAELRAWSLAPAAVVLPTSAAPEQKVSSSRSEDPWTVGKHVAPAGEGGTTGTLSVGTNEARGATSHSAGKRKAEGTQEADSVQHDTPRSKKPA